MKELCIYCAGEMGREIAELAEEMNKRNLVWSGISFIDDAGIEVMGRYRVLHINDPYFLENAAAMDIILANGKPETRKLLYEKGKEMGFSLYNLIAPSAEVSNEAEVGDGIIISRQSIVPIGCKIGRGCYINKRVTLGHDVSIDEFSIVNPGVVVGGCVEIGRESYIASGATVRDHVRIGEHCIVGMGSNVVSDVLDNQVVMGNPAKYVRDNIEGIKLGRPQSRGGYCLDEDCRHILFVENRRAA